MPKGRSLGLKIKINENIANITSTDMLELYNIFLSEYAK